MSKRKWFNGIGLELFIVVSIELAEVLQNGLTRQYLYDRVAGCGRIRKCLVTGLQK